MFTTDDLCSLRWNTQEHCTEIIDQTLLPHQLQWCQLKSLAHYCRAIADMQVRGAPLIGITAAFGLAHALFDDASDEGLQLASEKLLATRPTAVNLRWAINQVAELVRPLAPQARPAAALVKAINMRKEDIAHCENIGIHGAHLLRPLYTGETLNLMT
ncbi:MAG: hypothetical protein AB8B48_09045, partial [Pseudomonadales bacterium]